MKWQLRRHLESAQGYLLLKMEEDALAELDQALALDADNRDALYWKGLAHLGRGELVTAEESFRRLVLAHPTYAPAYVHLAYIHRRTVSLQKAVETIQQALRLDPKLPIALYNLACYRAVEGNAAEALRLLGEAVGLAKEYREIARTDPDFDSIRSLPEFQSLVGA